MALTQCLFNLKLHRIRPLFCKRHISTSKKSQETAVVKESCGTSGSEDVMAKLNSSWITYGFHTTSEKSDRTFLHMSLFGGITIGLVLVIYGFMYIPDVNLRHWAQREAYLELKRREDHGLPLIDANLVDPSKVILPSEEELCNVELII